VGIAMAGAQDWKDLSVNMANLPPDLLVLKRGNGKEFKLCCMGYELGRNRSDLAVDNRFDYTGGATK